MLMIGSGAGVIGTEYIIELFFFPHVSSCHILRRRVISLVWLSVLGSNLGKRGRLERPGGSDVDEDTFDDVC